jgi:hypothetical protein
LVLRIDIDLIIYYMRIDDLKATLEIRGHRIVIIKLFKNRAVHTNLRVSQSFWFVRIRNYFKLLTIFVKLSIVDNIVKCNHMNVSRFNH